MKLPLGLVCLVALLQGCGGGSSKANSAGDISSTSAAVSSAKIASSSAISSSYVSSMEASKSSGSIVSSASSQTSSKASSSANALAVNAASFTLTPQQTALFHFTWQDASGETEYHLLEKVNPSASFELIATLAADTASYDLPVSLVQKINASYQLQACINSVCTTYQTAAVSGNLAEAVGYIKASNTDASDSFGTKIAISADGNTLAVGAPYEASNSTGVNGDQTNNKVENSGAVYVFTREDSVWVQQAYLKASKVRTDDYFGSRLALSADGNTLAVGVPTDSSNATGVNGDQTNNKAGWSGAAYVFTRINSIWAQQAYVKASNTEGYDHFGGSLALSADGNTLAIGATYEFSASTGINGDQTNNAAGYSGAVYVFTRTNSIWAQQAYLKASNTEAFDYFGGNLTLSADGNTLAAFASGEDSSATGVNGDQVNNGADSSGAVYIFIRTGSIWEQQAYVKASNTEGNDSFGGSLILSADGNTLAVGALAEDSNSTGINGNQANNSAESSGAVYVFTRTGSVWAQQAYVKASNADANDWFGSSLALSADGNTLAVGAIWESSSAKGVHGNQTNNSTSESGAVYVFTRTGFSWAQKVYVKASNTNAANGFGWSLAISADGATLAVGAPGENSAAVGVNGNQTDSSARYSGAVYIY